MIELDVRTTIWLLRLIFSYFFFKEIYYTTFTSKNAKVIWFLIVLLFPAVGYSIFLGYKRRFVIKRSFNPDFSKLNNN